jgi:hypothetical protein
VESSHPESPSAGDPGKRVRKKSAATIRPTSPFELTSPENSMAAERRAERNADGRRSVALDRQELVENGVEIRKSLGQVPIA